MMCSFMSNARNAARLDHSRRWAKVPRSMSFLIAAALAGAQGAEPFDRVQSILQASCMNCHDSAEHDHLFGLPNLRDR